jgi:hypothetical protein
MRISEYANKTFTISADNGDSISELYAGKFIKAGDQVKSYEERKIVNLNEQLAELSKIINDQKDLLAIETSKVNSLQTANQTQNTTIQDLQNALNQQIIDNNALIEDDEIDEAEKQALATQIAELEAVNQGLISTNTSQRTVIDQLSAELITVDSNCPQQNINPQAKQASLKNTDMP